MISALFNLHVFTFWVHKVCFYHQRWHCMSILWSTEKLTQERWRNIFSQERWDTTPVFSSKENKTPDLAKTDHKEFIYILSTQYLTEMQEAGCKGGSRAEEILHISPGHVKFLWNTPYVGLFQQGIKDKCQVEPVHHSIVHILGIRQARIQSQYHTADGLLVLHGKSLHLCSLHSFKTFLYYTQRHLNIKKTNQGD